MTLTQSEQKIFDFLKDNNDYEFEEVDDIIREINSNIRYYPNFQLLLKELDSVFEKTPLNYRRGKRLDSLLESFKSENDKLIDGKQTAEDIKVEIAAEVTALTAAGQKVPHLAAILVGHDGGSETYVRNKVLACERVGFRSTLLRYEDDITEADLLAKVAELNHDPEIDGFIVQLPLPAHINPEKVIEAIRPEKDVDGFHPMNIGRMVAGLPALLPATPSGIVELLARQGIKTSGKHAVVIGRSNIVGTPVSILLAKNLDTANCTVTLCHSRTENLAEICRTADIVVAAIGRPEFVTADMVRPGAVVIDVGTTRVADANKKSGYTLKGDVNFAEVAPLASAITPVPGGVGPMTIAMLLLNTLRAAKGEIYPKASA